MQWHLYEMKNWKQHKNASLHIKLHTKNIAKNKENFWIIKKKSRQRYKGENNLRNCYSNVRSDDRSALNKRLLSKSTENVSLFLFFIFFVCSRSWRCFLWLLVVFCVVWFFIFLGEKSIKKSSSSIKLKKRRRSKNNLNNNRAEEQKETRIEKKNIFFEEFFLSVNAKIWSSFVCVIYFARCRLIFHKMLCLKQQNNSSSPPLHTKSHKK